MGDGFEGVEAGLPGVGEGFEGAEACLAGAGVQVAPGDGDGAGFASSRPGEKAKTTSAVARISGFN